jgi:hypothetical protein
MWYRPKKLKILQKLTELNETIGSGMLRKRILATVL